MILTCKVDLLKQKLNTHHLDCLSTLKECSVDTSRNPAFYLCESEEKSFNFDDIKIKYCKKINTTTVASMDSLYVKDKIVYLIEFKNQKGNKLKWREIKNKVHDSLIILKDEFDFEEHEYQLIQNIVVYAPADSESLALDRIKTHARGLMKNPHEISQFEFFKNRYGIKSLKFSNSDFKNYLKIC